MKNPNQLIVKSLGLTDYVETWQCMRQFTDARTSDTPDEMWLTEHTSVFTLGQTGNTEHFLLDSSIPVVHSDRGGQVTYHGPGQVVGYVLIDLRRAKCSVHRFVRILEQAMIDTLATFGVLAERIEGRPGVYTKSQKIGSLGLRVRRGCTFHGISLNVDMDLTPFDAIDPCGIPGMTVTQLADLAPNVQISNVRDTFSETFIALWRETCKP